MPLAMAHIACSRRPKCMLRPAYDPALDAALSGASNSPAAANVRLVLVDGDRSAAPPSSHGNARGQRVLHLARRVARGQRPWRPPGNPAARLPIRPAARRVISFEPRVRVGIAARDSRRSAVATRRSPLRPRCARDCARSARARRAGRRTGRPDPSRRIAWSGALPPRPAARRALPCVSCLCGEP